QSPHDPRHRAERDTALQAHDELRDPGPDRVGVQQSEGAGDRRHHPRRAPHRGAARLLGHCPITPTITNGHGTSTITPSTMAPIRTHVGRRRVRYQAVPNQIAGARMPSTMLPWNIASATAPVVISIHSRSRRVPSTQPIVHSRYTPPSTPSDTSAAS